MKKTGLNYKTLDHTADIGIRVKAAGLKQLFADAALAMLEVIVECDEGGRGETREISIEGRDYPDLMVRWLSEILYLFAGEKLVTGAVDIVSLFETNLVAKVSVSVLDGERHRVIREIKGVTYHDITVRRVVRGWQAKIIFDI